MTTPHDPRCPLGPRQIRLLELHSGKPNDLVHCSIRVVSLDSTPPPQYEALSYTWGSPTETEPMILEGYPMRIGKNLHAALKHLRYRPVADNSKLKMHGASINSNHGGVGVHLQNPPMLVDETRGQARIIWADAICIDQEKEDEKVEQLQLMGEIYRTCSQAVIWLGGSTRYTERAFMMAFWLCKVAYHQMSRMRPGGGADPHDDGSAIELYGKPNFKTLIQLDDVHIKWSMCQCWKELQALVTRDWFLRAWVVQEAALPAHVTVVCGYYSIPWNELVVALRCVPRIPIRPMGGLPLPSHVVVIERLRQELAEKKTSLETILLRNSSCKATVAMDRVYAFLGLVQQTELKELDLVTPNYTTLSFKQLCQQVAVAIIKKSGNLNLLSGPVGNPGRRVGWPSWIPDWEADQRPRCLILDQPSFDASQSKLSPVTVLINNEKSLLDAEGFVYDRIEELSRVTDKSPPSTWTFTQYHTYKARMQGMVEFLQLCLEWEKITGARSRRKYRGSTEPMLDAYWKTLLGGHIDPENEAAQSKEFRRFDMISKDGAKVLQSLGLPAWPWIMALTPHNLSVLLFRALVTRRDIPGLLGRIGDFTANRNFAFVLNRRVMRTSGGCIGLAPAAAGVGDLVSLIKGARVPLIIRQKGQRWELVGESYVHGIMDGQAWDGDKSQRMYFE